MERVGACWNLTQTSGLKDGPCYRTGVRPHTVPSVPDDATRGFLREVYGRPCNVSCMVTLRRRRATLGRASCEHSHALCGFYGGSTIAAPTLCPTDGFVYGSTVSACQLSGESSGGSAGMPVNCLDDSSTGSGPMTCSLPWIRRQFYYSSTSR